MNRSASQIRREFIDFFAQRHGHAFVPSSPVVPHDDPTLLFTNAGMNQFKDVFLGTGTRDYVRAANSQKCIRAGGKHNDLEDVGRDTYHHTFFEMLGNWSFGDYFKDEAIAWAWELLTGVWGLDPSRLHVTVFEGSADDGLPPDEEAERLWARFVPTERISRWGRKDNFWEMGDTGPCGPCSEIHYDGTPDRSGGHLVNKGDPRVIEIWNLVFMQFNRGAGGRLTPLPAKHVDTGMGFERIVRVLQGKDSNYDTDVWAGIFEAIRARTGARPYGAKLHDPLDVAYRVLADHLRCLSVAIADGAAPGSDGRSYVLRRILRRAVRMARQAFDVSEPMLCDLVPAVVGSLGEAFPELRAQADRCAHVIREEEAAFLRTIDRGIELFGEAAARARGAGGTIGADDAFRLHDTYGFPIDLTRIMAEEQALRVDEAGYERLMDEARERSRHAGEADHRLGLPPDVLAALPAHGAMPTDDSRKYDPIPCAARLRAIWTGEHLVEQAGPGQAVALVLDRTNFYAEQGGQVADHGWIRATEPDAGAETNPMRAGIATGEGVFRVEDVRAVGGYVLHVGQVHSGTMRTGDAVEVEIDVDRRKHVAANHTATHVLNLALRNTLPDPVEQKGSLVAPDRLRFDFSAGHALSPEQLATVERMVRRQLQRDVPVYTGLVPLDEARRFRGVRAVFGEKYPDPVRVVSIGMPIADLRAHPDRESLVDVSIEFCGGTHLPSFGDAQAFVLLSEQGLAAGVRRVVALTGTPAVAAGLAAAGLDRQIEEAESLADDAFLERFETIAGEFEAMTLGAVDRHRIAPRLDALRERAKTLRKRRQASARDEVVEHARRIAETIDGPVLVDVVPGADRDLLLSAMDVIRARRPDTAALLLSPDHDEGKVTIAAIVPKPLIDRGLKAGDWVREAARVCGGSGGGRPDMAQAGGKDPAKALDAADAAKAFAMGKLR